MSWIRRETEKGTVQYICPRCHDYHEFREDFGERTFSENYIFCRRCGARNGTGNAPTLTPPNEWVEALEAINNAAVAYIEGGPYENHLPGMELAVEIDRLSRDFVRPPEGEEDT